MTLSQQSLRLVSHLSNKLDYWTGVGLTHLCHDDQGPQLQVPEPGSSSGETAEDSADGHREPDRVNYTAAGDDGSVTVACRGFGEGAPWVVALRDQDTQLLVAMESVLDSTLTGALQQVRTLSDLAIPNLL